MSINTWNTCISHTHAVATQREVGAIPKKIKVGNTMKYLILMWIAYVHFIILPAKLLLTLPTAVHSEVVRQTALVYIYDIYIFLFCLLSFSTGTFSNLWHVQIKEIFNYLKMVSCVPIKWSIMTVHRTYPIQRAPSSPSHHLTLFFINQITRNMQYRHSTGYEISQNHHVHSTFFTEHAPISKI